MGWPGVRERFRRSKVDRYLLAGEREIFAQRQHWASIAEPVTSTVAGLLVALLLDSVMSTHWGLITDLLWWGWFFLVGRALWRWFMWRRDWFVATDKRLVKTYGLITQKVAMMPLSKVTDMTYNRSPVGRLLGYGTFVMESAGQDQALRQVDWVADPDQTYRAICAEIFEVADLQRPAEDEHLHLFEDGPPPHTPGLDAGYVPAAGRTGPSDSPIKTGNEPDQAEPDQAEPDQTYQPDEADVSTRLPIRYGTSHRQDRESWFDSPDLDFGDHGDHRDHRDHRDHGDHRPG